MPIVKQIYLIAALAWLGLVGTLAIADTATPAPIAPWVEEQTADGGEARFFAMLEEQADLSAAPLYANKVDRGRYVYETLRNTAERTQAPLRVLLDSLGVDYRPFWVVNAIVVSGDRSIVDLVASHPDVASIHANPSVRMETPYAESGPEAIDGIEWNIELIGAPTAWGLGSLGQGAVVGGQDTGYDWDHPALIRQYRGYENQAADHDYSWHDAIHSGGGVCGADSPEPCDDNNHGTHTMGTIVGDDGGDNQIGVAPEARWIGCRNMDRGVGTPESYAECYQWFIAPTRVDGSDPDPSMAPHVINNSWGCPPSEGCTDPNVLKTVVENVRAAGILSVHSAGNAGPSCGSVDDPAAIYDASFSVAATDINDRIASFSSRGPVEVDGSGRLKPDISAPGVGVRSSVPGGGYRSLSGTSMAGPHVVGLTALVISSDPALAGQVDLLEARITSSAIGQTTNDGCGGDSPTDVPNHTFGWGRIDAPGAVETPPDVAVDIRANGSDGPIEIARGDRLEVTISLDAGEFGGMDGDYWVLATLRPIPLPIRIHYDLDDTRWHLGWSVSRQGELTDLSETTILDTSRLPAGKYNFMFGVDDQMDGERSPSIVEDAVDVTITR